MEIPKYIDDLLEKKAKLAMEFMSVDSEICQWIEKNNVTVSPDDIATGCISICEPHTSIENIRECIRDKE